MNRERITLTGAAILLLLSLFLFREHAVQRERIQELESELAELEEENAFFSELCRLAAEERLGYAGEDFRADKSVLVLSLGETAELGLTASWEGVGNVFLDCRGDAAVLSFTEESWEKDTSILIEGVQPGLTVVEFRSDAQEESFYVWILVKK